VLLTDICCMVHQLLALSGDETSSC